MNDACFVALTSVACKPGFIAAAAKADKCTFCLPGTAAGSPGLSKCTDCIPGFAAPAQQAVECEACKAGFIAAAPKADKCTFCLPGTMEREAQSEASLCTERRSMRRRFGPRLLSRGDDVQ